MDDKNFDTMRSDYIASIRIKKRLADLKGLMKDLPSIIKDILTTFGYSEESKDINSLKDLEEMTINSYIKNKLIELVFDTINIYKA